MDRNIRLIPIDEVARYLAEVDLELGDWSEIRPKGGRSGKQDWVSIQAPRDAQELLCLSQHAAGWVPRGAWKIIQFDNSNWFSRVENVFVGGLVGRPTASVDFSSTKRSAILFEFGADADQNANLELLVSDLVYAILLFEGHAYLTSSGSAGGECLGVQDGFLYFQARTADIPGAVSLIEQFRRDPMCTPQWVVDIVARDQE
jgi:hypothetical protein